MNKEEKAVFVLKLKTNRLIRICAYPYVNLKRLKIKSFYKKSEYSQKIRTLKNKFAGERCFIIGNGPSLNPEDLNRIKNEYSFAANKIFYIFDKTEWRPTFYSCADPEVYLIIKDYFLSADIKYKFLCLLCEIPKKISPNLYPVYHYEPFHCNRYKEINPFVNENADEFLGTGYTVTFTNIQLAFYMGFKEIYLLGVDHNYSLTIDKSGKIIKNDKVQNYFDGMPKSDFPAMYNFTVTNKAYKAAQEYADSHNIKVYNATRGGKLEIFRRVDFDELIKGE